MPVVAAGRVSPPPGVGAGPVSPPPPGVEVETATWRPLEVVHLDGWRLGLSGGLTRRANSVVPLLEPRDAEATIDRVEGVYAEHGLPAVVRICSAAAPGDLDIRLDRRGYRAVGHTDVRVADLRGWDASVAPPGSAAALDDAAPRGSDASIGPPGSAAALDDAGLPDGTTVTVEPRPSDGWLGLWAGAKAFRPGTGAVARRILLGSPAAYLTVTDAEGAAAVARIARAGDWAALSCLAVDPRARRRGLGRALSRHALRVGAERGATRAFLQVERGNAAAAALYDTLGFVVADTYHYRQLG